jgi:hypothetical protein
MDKGRVMLSHRYDQHNAGWVVRQREKMIAKMEYDGFHEMWIRFRLIPLTDSFDDLKYFEESRFHHEPSLRFSNTEYDIEATDEDFIRQFDGNGHVFIKDCRPISRYWNVAIACKYRILAFARKLCRTFF